MGFSGNSKIQTNHLKDNMNANPFGFRSNSHSQSLHSTANKKAGAAGDQEQYSAHNMVAIEKMQGNE